MYVNEYTYILYNIEWHALNLGYALLETITGAYENIRRHSLARTNRSGGPGEFGPGWLGMAGKSWPGPAAEFNVSYI